MERARLEEEHRAYWSEEAIACRERFAKAVGKTTIEEAFHIRDGFRILCDALLPDMTECGNNLGFAPLPDSHDGLCERCRRHGYPHPPRITMSPNGIVWGSPGYQKPSKVPRGDAYEG